MIRWGKIEEVCAVLFDLLSLVALLCDYLSLFSAQNPFYMKETRFVCVWGGWVVVGGCSLILRLLPAFHRSALREKNEGAWEIKSHDICHQ